MSLVGRSRSPAAEQLPGWQRDLILKKRAMGRMFPRLYPAVVEISGGDDPHADPGHAPLARNNSNNRNDAWLQQQQHQVKQSRFGATSAYSAFNGSRAKEQAAISSNNNHLNSFNDVGSRGELGRMVSNGGGPENGVAAEHDDELDGSAEEFEYGPGIVHRLRSKFNSLTARELGLSGAAAPLSPVRRVASLEQLLEADDPEPYQASRSPPAQRPSVELLKRARSMETLSAIDRSPGLTLNTSMFGPRVTFGPLSPVNDKVIIIEQARPAVAAVPPPLSPRANGVMPRPALIDEELPPPNTVRINKQIFEAEPKPMPAAAKPKVVIRTPPPKPTGPKPALRARPPASPTLPQTHAPQPHQPKKVFVFLQELAEKDEQATKALTVAAVTQRSVSPVAPAASPPRHPSPVTASLPKHPPAVFTPPAASLPVVTLQTSSLPKHPPPAASLPKHAPAVFTPPAASPPVVTPQTASLPKHVPTVLTPPAASLPVVTPQTASLPKHTPAAVTPPAKHPQPVVAPQPKVPAANIVGETFKHGANAGTQPTQATAVLQNGLDAVPLSKETNVAVIKPFVPEKEPDPVVPAKSAASAPPPSTGKPVSDNSVKFNFMNDISKKPHLPTGGGHAAASAAAAEEDDFPMEDLLARPASVDFVGDNVIVGRSALMKTRNKKLKLVFDDQALSTYEYPSESSLLEGEHEDPAGHRGPEEHPQSAIKVRASIEMGPSVLKSTPAIGSSLGGLSSYTPLVVGSAEAFELGVSRAPNPPPPAPTKAEPDKDDEESLFLKPAADHDNVLWSNAATSDILF